VIHPKQVGDCAPCDSSGSHREGPVRTRGHCLAFRQGVPMAGVFEVPDGNPPLQPLPLPMCGRARVVPGQTPGPLVHGVLAPRSDYGAGSHSLPPTTKQGGEDSRRVDGTLAHSSKGNKTISEHGKSPIAGSTSSLPPTTEHGGEPRRVDGTLAH
jgi:hypothetical protein